MTTPRIGAVVLAGGRVPASLASLCTHRALLRLGDRYLLDYLLATLARVPAVVDFALVAPQGALDALDGLPGKKIASGDSLVENMRLGAAALADPALTHMLYVTGDIPLVTVAGWEYYINESVASGAALTYPIIPRAVSEQRFPGARRTYVTLHDGVFTGGNAIFTVRNLLDDQGALIQQLYSARKNPVKLAGLLGMKTVWGLLTKSLTLTAIEQVATRILQAPARAIITPFAEIGFDVDKPDDLTAVQQALTQMK